ncbi:MAG: 5'-3' exonuclease H3TH domain-containing protein [Bacteroidota bacterium]|nr:5'-3' exonuclease H3TH domain-containing protein [Bacteroidota bacterium]
MTKSWNDLADLQSPDYDAYSNLLLIDANNLSYRWLQRPNYSSSGDDFIRTIQSLSKSYEAKRTVVCFDFGKSYYRMDMLDEYKGTRKKPQDEDEAKKYEEFFAVLNDLPDQLDEEVLKFRGVEADDILAYMVKKYEKTEEYDHIWIVSSDRDLYQLVGEKTSIFNIFGRREITNTTMHEDMNISPELYLLSRYIEGDKSDNILGIEGIGPKRAQALAKEYKTLPNLIDALPIKGRAKYIQNLNAGKDTLIRNEKLINLRRYCEDAICAGKYGDEPLEKLKSM